MSEAPETISLLGEPLYAHTAVPADRLPELEQAAAEAKAAYEADPTSVEAIRAYAKSLAAMHRFRAAIAVLTEALAQTPAEDVTMLLCDRGHYYVNLREFDLAKRDLQRAAAQEQGEFDIWYHLALAQWFSGETEQALANFHRTFQVAADDSHKAAITDWLYMCLSRLGRRDEALPLLEDIHADMVMTGNNHLYLKQLLFYKGEITEAEMDEICAQGGLALTNNFTMGCWHLSHNRPERAKELFERVVQKGTVWGAFGHIGAEAELARIATK